MWEILVAMCLQGDPCMIAQQVMPMETPEQYYDRMDYLTDIFAAAYADVVYCNPPTNDPEKNKYLAWEAAQDAVGDENERLGFRRTFFVWQLDLFDRIRAIANNCTNGQ